MSLRALPLALVVAGMLVPLAACTADVSATPSTSGQSSPTTTVTPVAPSSDPEIVGVVVVGDSNSTGFMGTFDTGLAAGAAWAAQLDPESFAIAGAWAVDGSTSAAMADGATSISAEGADQLIVMAGTNDIGAGIPAAETTRNLDRIAAEVGASRVAVTAIAPLDPRPDDAIALNRALADFAASRGWQFIDPWTDLRTPAGMWVSDYRTDGVHTTVAGYARAGAVIADQLRPGG